MKGMITKGALDHAGVGYVSPSPQPVRLDTINRKAFRIQQARGVRIQMNMLNHTQAGPSP
jgi:hypothetical protein